MGSPEVRTGAPGASPRPRRWRGRDPDDRVRERRARLVAAAFDLLAAEGAGAVTMRGVCRAAGLTERYFYESFPDRGALLRATLADLVDDALGVAETAVGGAEPSAVVRDVVVAFTAFLDDDPRRATVLFDEAPATADLARPGLALVARFVELIAVGFDAAGLPAPAADAADRSLNAVAAFGVLSRLYAARSAGTLAVTDERFVEHAVAVLERVARTSTAGRGTPR